MGASATFDPDRIARYEVAGWRAYYDRRWATLLRLTVTLCQEQFQIPFPRSLIVAYEIVRASIAWVPVEHDLARVTEHLTRFYALAARYAPLDFVPQRVAAAEVRYWEANRRLAGQRDDPELKLTLTQLHSAIFGLTNDEAYASAEWRVRATISLDRITGGTTDDAEDDWQQAEEALRQCYRAIGRYLTARQPTVGAPAPTRSNDYHFVTHWRMQGTPDEVIAVLADARDLVRWWPSVYLKVWEITPGDEQGIGKVVELLTKGWLPYTIRWRFRVEESDPPRRIAIAASGDLEGRGVWTLEPDGDQTDVTYDWRIRGDKPLFRYGSFILKPLFAANHRWAMARGAESMAIELRRRRATTDAEHQALPAPPGPTSGALIALGTVIIVGVGLVILGKRYLSPNE
ncbi:MAG TPA: SRPBCC family protein [Thermomicrobiales bacterium]|jgi:hypothetical protein